LNFYSDPNYFLCRHLEPADQALLPAQAGQEPHPGGQEGGREQAGQGLLPHAQSAGGVRREQGLRVTVTPWWMAFWGLAKSPVSLIAAATALDVGLSEAPHA